MLHNVQKRPVTSAADANLLLPTMLYHRVLCAGAVWCCRFTFDHVYDQDSSQQEVYNQSARPLVLSTLQVLG